jgi:hypothetical protein
MARPILALAPRFADLLALSLSEQAERDGFETRAPASLRPCRTSFVRSQTRKDSLSLNLLFFVIRLHATNSNFNGVSLPGHLMADIALKRTCCL